MRWILAVDTAANSGWSITDCNGKHFSSGECNAFTSTVTDVCRLILSHDPKATMLLEKPSHGNRSQLVGMGAARGAWIAAWSQAGGRKPSDVFPATWRSSIFGDTAKNALRERLTAQVFSKKSEPGPDESAAVCISVFATRKASAKPDERRRDGGVRTKITRPEPSTGRRPGR